MIFLSLGSNLSSSFGNRFDNINFAISFIQENKIHVINQSSYYETNSFPDSSKPKYINIIIKVSTTLTPSKFASILLSIEEKLERKRFKKNDPRTCDIDIIDYNNEVIDIDLKNINFFSPHKNLSSRNFVLYPLKEILPSWKHPLTNESIDVLISKLPIEDKNSILKIKKLL